MIRHRTPSAYAAVLLLAFGLLTPLPAPDQLPEFSGEWVNGEPLVAADVKGKLIVLIFFDEAAVEYKTLWAEMEKAKLVCKPDDNVIFIAINSGTPKAALLNYATAHRLTWRLLADEARTYEQQFGFRIDKSNYRKLFFVNPYGNLREMDGNDFEKELQKAVDSNRNAIQWKIKPAEVPAAAKQMWTALEMGNWKFLCGAVEINLRAREPELRACAEKCDKLIVETIKTKTEEAKKVLESGDKWAAYKLLYRLTDGFQRRHEARPAYDLLAKLANEAQIIKSQNARRSLDEAEARIRDILQPGAKAWYEAVQKNYPDTEAAAIAKALVESAEKDGPAAK